MYLKFTNKKYIAINELNTIIYRKKSSLSWGKKIRKVIKNKKKVIRF